MSQTSKIYHLIRQSKATNSVVKNLQILSLDWKLLRNFFLMMLKKWFCCICCQLIVSDTRWTFGLPLCAKRWWDPLPSISRCPWHPWRRCSLGCSSTWVRRTPSPSRSQWRYLWMGKREQITTWSRRGCQWPLFSFCSKLKWKWIVEHSFVCLGLP